MSDVQNIVDKMVWVHLRQPDDFLKIKETLTRIGVASRKDKKLYQSCHILHKRGRYAIVHFKELFALDGKPSDFYDNEQDIGRRNTIVNLLEQWDLLTVENSDQIDSPRTDMSQIKIIPFKEKNEWELVAKYNIGSGSK
jgi:hypothetical protein